MRDVRFDGLAALISKVDLSGWPGSPDDLRAHREILDATATEVPVLPLPFRTIMTSEDAAAKDLLAAHHDEFTAALDQLEGRTEFQVKGRNDHPAAKSGYYTAVNLNSGKCLDVTGRSTANGVHIQQWTCNGGTNQQWFEQVP